MAGNLAVDLYRLQELERIACERSLAQFIKSSWHLIEPGTPLQWNWHLDTLCGYLEAVHRGEIQYLIINIPPGHMKSTLLSVGFPAWEWTSMPHLRFLGITNEQGLALRDALRAKIVVESDWYQSNWPLLMNKRQNEKSLYQNEHYGHRQSIGINANITGKRGDRLLIDDGNDTKKVESAAERTNVNDTYDLKIANRLNDPRSSSITQISQRSNVEDLTGHMLTKKKTNWVHVIIPSEYEGEDTFDAGKDIGRPELNDPRTEKGELLFKARFTPEVVAQEKENLGLYGTAGQLQQRPSPKGGGLFKDTYWRFYEHVPTDIILIRIYADTASKTKEHNDYTVFQAWGLTATGNIYLLDQIRGKWEAPLLETSAVAFWNKHKPTLQKPIGATVMKVEDKSSGTSLIQNIASVGSIPIEPIQRNIDKVVRAIGIIPRLAQGLAYLPKYAPWLNDYLVEFSLFTPLMTHKNDDQIDPTMDAVEDLVIFRDMLYTKKAL